MEKITSRKHPEFLRELPAGHRFDLWTPDRKPRGIFAEVLGNYPPGDISKRGILVNFQAGLKYQRVVLSGDTEILDYGPKPTYQLR